MSISALLACLCFYSALYLIYFFFFHQQHAMLLFLAVILLVFSCWITPFAYEKSRGNYDRTMSWGQYLATPLILWGRLFIPPARFILNLIFRD